MDSMLCRLQPRLVEFALDLPASIFRPRWEIGIREGLKIISFTGIWRDVPMPLDDNVLQEKKSGYWLREIIDDVNQGYVMGCFGTNAPMNQIEWDQPEGVCMPGSTVGWGFK
jgi:hypothetical protein